MNSGFSQLQDVFTVLENSNRAKILLATYLAGKTDMNSAKDIGTICGVLYGEELSAASLTSNLNRLDAIGLILKEKEVMVGSVATNFHSMTDLGRIGLLYLFLTTMSPILIQDEEKLIKLIQNQDFRQVINYLLKESYEINKSIRKFITKSIQTKKEKIPLIKIEPLTLEPPRIFAGKNPLRLKIFEELIWDHLDVGAGLSLNDFLCRLNVSSRITSHLKALLPLLEEINEGKQKYYRLSRRGLLALVPFSWLLASTIGDSRAEIGTFLAAPHVNDNPLSTLVRNSLNFFSKMKEIMGEL
ncbi:MAG: hypothetical protein ACFFCQ_13545 [Promethearchaeota archaeon]